LLLQAVDGDCTESKDVLDPMHVPGRGTPKKKLKSVSDSDRSKKKCTQCKSEGHNPRTCSMREEVV
jgi:zinc finger SWIM domain-containing protein 3